MDESLQTPSRNPQQSPTPVDFANIENQKENILPLAGGRSAASLSSIFSSSNKNLHHQLEDGHKQFNSQIHIVDMYDRGHDIHDIDIAASGLTQEALDDPLDIYTRYVRWVINFHPSGSLSSLAAAAATSPTTTTTTSSSSQDNHPPSSSNITPTLIPLLERATRRFLKDKRYVQDQRYLRLWSLYAKELDPEHRVDLWRFLLANEVGTNLANLYEELALCLETAARRKDAAAIFMLGLARQASPLDRLKKRYEAFQARMLIAPAQPSPPLSEETSGTLTTKKPVRPILGGGKAGGLGNAAAATPRSNSGSNSSNGASAFTIFQDPAAAAAASSSSQDDNDPSKQDWDDIGTKDGRRKENRMEVRPWKGETMPMHKTSNQVERFTVFRDAPETTPTSNNNNNNNKTSNHHHHQTIGEDPFGRESRRGPTESELLRSNPFKNYDSIPDLFIIPKEEDLLKHQQQQQRQKNDSKDRNRKVRDPAPPSKLLSSSKSSSSSSRSTNKAAGETSKSKHSRPPASSSSSSSLSLGPGEPSTSVNMAEIYPKQGGEVSLEETLAAKRKKNKANKSAATDDDVVVVDDGGGSNELQDNEEWVEEAIRTRKPFDVNPNNGLPLFLYQRRKKNMESSSSLEPLSDEAHAKDPNPSTNPPPSNPSTTIIVGRTKRARIPLGTKLVAGHHGNSEPSKTQETPSRRLDLSFNHQSSFSILPDEPPNTSSSGALIKDDSPPRHGYPPEQEENDDDGEGDDDDETDSSASSEATYEDFETQVASPGLSPSSSGPSHSNGLLRKQRVNMPSPTMTTADALHQVNQGSPTLATRAAMASMDALWDATLTFDKTTNLSDRTQLSLPSDELNNTTSGRQTPPFLDRSPLDGDPDDSDEEEYDEEREATERAGDLTDDDDDDVPASEEQIMAQAQAYQQLHQPNTFGRDRLEGFNVGGRYHIMTPITERTGEMTAFSQPTANYPLQDQGLDNSHPYDLEQAFVAEASANDTDPEDYQHAPRTPTKDHTFEKETSGYKDLTCKDGSLSTTPSHSMTDGPSVTVEDQMSSLSLLEKTDEDNSGSSSLLDKTHRSFNTSNGSFHLPEGLTIAGNQSGMVTSFVLVDKATRADHIPGNKKDPTNTPTLNTLYPNPCDPFDSDILDRILEQNDCRPEQLEGFHNFLGRCAGQLPDLKRTAKQQARRSSGSNTSRVDDQSWRVTIGNELFWVKGCIGNGAFGSVFLIEDDDDLAVKVESPPNRWEFRVLRILQDRLPPSMLPSVIKAHSFYNFEDESFLTLEYCDQGSLLDVVNRAVEYNLAPSTTSAGLQESLAIFFTIELIKVVESLHNARIIHGDFKIDNVLLRLETVPGGNSDWKTVYDPTGAGGWAQHGIKVIDFGRAIDLAVFPHGQQFVSDLETDKYDCSEMREGRPWTYEPDYFGLASIAFCLLFGKYMETVSVTEPDGSKKYAIKEPLRRYHQVDLWSRLFDILLNPRGGRATLPITNELASIRSDMEVWLIQASTKGGLGLKGLLKRVQTMAMERVGFR